ncbi:uncharacterized protein T551_00739 [Pneumocystis jirovecii RU7]|uniref:Roadblock/LAMTOR2 domain-containing protein n=1 Tax=Pneumocystis jirovecii (strain RU7) TaxID=1408657 RepID=A0A0W4ZUK7_PNEJ7|nr:uncharacterized protein T551_00739 [Pneumocystis jirovecii RU7]KTW32057.1 hypothetical protein T551_00739 [Pneumocystis jirovecii RU7]
MFETAETLLSRILTRQRVQGLLVLEKTTDTIIQTTLSQEIATSCAEIIKSMLNSTEALMLNLASTDVLQFIRMKMQMHELMIVPGPEYLLVVMVSI